jgi:beta-glucosidase
LSIVDADGTREIVSGELQVWVGGGQPVTGEGLPKTAGISGSVKVEEPALLPK